LDLNESQKDYSIKEPKYVENSLLYEGIVVEDFTTFTIPNNCSTNTHANIKANIKEMLANVPLKTSKEVKESLHTTPVKQLYN